MITKCPCEQCGVNIEFEAESAGQFYPCPACGKQTRLALPATVKPVQLTAIENSKKRSILRTAKTTVLWTLAVFAVLFAISRIVGERDPFKESNNHPSKYCGVYALSFGDYGSLEVDFRSDGSGLFCGSPAEWSENAEGISIRTKDGRGNTFKPEGQDLIARDGKRWRRQ